MPALYFVLAFAITWGLQLPAVLALRGVIAGPPEKYMALVGLGAFGPMFAAMIASRADKTGIRALFRPLKTWRVGLGWYLVALGLSGVLFAIAALVYNAFGHTEQLVYPPNQPAFMLAAIVFPFGEEIGWRGYALPRLRDRVGPIRASVIIGVFWALWHIPMLMLQGYSAIPYFAFIPYLVSASIVFTWIYQHTQSSLLLAVLTHVGAHLNNPGHALPGRATPLVIHTVAYVILAIGLVMFDRKAFATHE